MYIGTAALAPTEILVLSSAVIDASANTTIIAASSGRRIRVYAVKLVAGSAAEIKWSTTAASDIEGLQSFPLNGGYTEAVDPPTYLFSTPISQGLVIKTNAPIAGRISYWLE